MANTVVRRAAFQLLWVLIGLGFSNAFAGGVDPRGIYIAAPVLESENDLVAPEVYKVAGIDGVAIRIPWRVLQPARGKYDWSLLDTEIGHALAHRKKISIGVIAASYSPSWIAQLGAQSSEFMVSRGSGECITANIPHPWDTTYQKSYVAMMEELKRHLQSKSGAYEALAVVKLGAVSQHGLELRLPNDNGQRKRQRAGGDGACPQSDAISIWQNAGYRPSRVLQGWTAMAEGVGRIFEDKLVAQAILETQGFPAIGEDGETIPRRNVTLSSDILQKGIKDFGKRFVVQWNALKPQGKLSDRTLQALKEGASIAWQSNLYQGRRGGAGCQENRRQQDIPCSAEDYLAMLRRGFKTGATFIEVWQPDVVKFPAAIATAHQEWLGSSASE